MTTKATFDAATLADAVGKASRIAPVKGAAFDKAAGLLFEVTPGKFEYQALLKATNLDVTYRQELDTAECVGDPANWRIPAPILAGLTANLSLGAGQTVSFIDKGDGAIRIVAGQMVVKLSMYEGDFPTIDPFPTADLSDANDFAHKVNQVAWACDKDNSVLSGVHIDGESIIGCDRFTAAIMPCRVPIAKPVTVPLFTVSAVLAKASDVRVSASERTLNLSLDTETQMTTRIFEQEYPNVKRLLRTDYTGTIEVPRQRFVDTMNRMMVVARSERLPAVKMTINGTGLVKSMTMDLDVEGTGRIQDTLDIGGEYDDLFELWFTPTHLVPAIENSTEESVLLRFGHPDPDFATKKPISITDTKGYECLVTPRQQ